LIINKKLTAVVVLTVYVFLQAPTDVAAAGIKQIQALIAEERLEEALSLTNEELKRGNVDVNYRFLKGLILIRLNRLEQAVDVFTGITESHPELPEPYNNLAVIHAAMGDLDEARQALQQAINTHPSYATAHENIGDIYAKLASQAYNQALQLDQANATAKAKLSLIKDLFSVPEPERETALAEAIDEAPPPRKQKEQPESSTVTATSDGTDSRKEATAAELKPEEEIIESVRAAVSDWAGDWSSQDVEAYLTR